MADPLNILHTIGLDELYPVVRCELRLADQLDVDRLKRAVVAVGKIIPEIFASYEVADNRFVPLDRDAATIVKVVTDYDEGAANRLDFMNQPQLKIIVTGEKLIIFVSHILSDGAGTKQLLYLLAECYNRQAVPKGIQNHTDIDGIRQLLATTKPTVNTTDHPSEKLLLPKLADSQSPTYEVIYTQLSEQQTQALHATTRKLGVTLNDMLMAAFGKTIQQYCGVGAIALACPTDMRQYLPAERRQQLRVQNMTARYNFDVVIQPEEGLAVTAKKVHEQMVDRKKAKQFLDSIRGLVAKVEAGQPIDELQKAVEASYHVREIAYTNFGIVDQERLNFAGTTVNQLIMTGSFRRMPMYQVAISTFNSRITLAVNMIGSRAERQFGRAVLDHMRVRLLAITDDWNK